jgi:predicted dehydrogenase/threonine dehydrogenase-like Zn-dependent dehydrogenase
VKVLLNSLKSGATSLVETPWPRAGRNGLVIATRRSLVSAGTERMLVEFGKKGLIGKARAQPDKVRQVLAKMKSDGVMGTLEAVRSKLDEPVQLGYSNVGTVVEVGPGVSGFGIGDRVVSNSPHAEIVAATRTTATRIPDEVSDDAAAFAVVGAIGLQGMRLAAPALGETVAVYGLGLIGLMTAQLLVANGCRVIGFDLDAAKCRLAESFGAQGIDLSAGADPVEAAMRASRGRGVDAVIITAAAPGSEIVHNAAAMCRKRGRIVLTGVVGLDLVRDDFYRKELSFQVSAAYGPGRYDPEYEAGQDYPAAFVRWTQQRNIEAVLDMMAAGRIDTAPLISHRFPFARAADAYALLTGAEPSLGILLDYAEPAEAPERSVRTGPAPKEGAIAIVGAGNYASRVLIPAFKAAGAELALLVSNGAPAAARVAKRFGISEVSSDGARLFDDPAIGTIVVATRHDSHADLVVRALESGRNVFVEKPLCLTIEELERIEAAHDETGGLLAVGFNRRLAPMVVRLKQALDAVSAPKAMVMIVNAGAVPADHWIQDDVAGGGRIVGECCHFIDLLRHLAGAPITGIEVARVDEPGGRADDKATLTLAFADGSIGTVHYFANGHKAVAKERLEVFAGGRVYQLDNYRRLTAHGDARLGTMRSMHQDKGQNAFAAAFLEALKGGPPPIPAEELFEVARASILAAELARSGGRRSAG